MSLEDTYFGCSEVPLSFPPAFNIQDVQKCNSCTLRLTAQIAGPGLVRPRLDGLSIDENPTVSFAVNGIDHNLVETILTIPGAHRLPGHQVPCDAELFLFFQNTRDYTKQVALVVPINISPGEANPYFATLNTHIQNNRPTVDTVVPRNTQILMYPGADIRGRTKENPRPSDQCEPVKRVITYYFCLTPGNIGATDYDRLLTIAGEQRKGPAKPRADALVSRLRALATFIGGINITEHAVSNGNGVSTKSLKCYRIDKRRDVINDKVYVGDQKKPGRTLDQEIADNAIDLSGSDVDPTTGNSVRPGDIETILGIVLGVTVGVIVCATIAFLIWKYTFSNYLYAQKLYNSPLSAASLSVKVPSLPRICPPTN